MTRQRLLSFPLLLLAGLHVASLADGFLAPNSALEQHRELPWAPPTPLRWFDAEGRFHPRPFIYPLLPDAVELDIYTADTASPAPLRLFVRGASYRLAGLFETDLHLLGVDPPARLLLLGSDGLGRDVFARLLLGARVSLFAGLFAASLALTTAFVLGSSAGYFGGRLDALLMRLVELFLALPWLYLLLGLRAFLPLTLSTTQTFFLIVAVIGLLGWARPARLVRGLVLSTREQDFVLAARALGASNTHILRRHIFPQTLGLLATQAAILAPQYILAEVTLSYLGLGIAEPTPSWGNLLAQLQHFYVLSRYWWMLSPAVGLSCTFLAYHAFARNTLQR